MRDLTFDFEWVDPGGARGPELSATWARLEIRASDGVLTRVFDKHTRSVRDGIYLPLYPLAEWMVSNWWRLLFEARSSPLAGRNGYSTRHNLSAVGEGFALPDVSIEPMGEILKLSWESRSPSWAPLEFLSHGVVFLGREFVREVLADFIEAIVGRLDGENVEKTWLHEEWNAIKNLGDEEETFCRLAAAIGVDPFQVEAEQADHLIQAATQLPQAIQEEFFSSADPSTVLSEALALEEALKSTQGHHEQLGALAELRRAFSISLLDDFPMAREGARPWEQGYSFARRLRAELDLNGLPVPTFEAMGQKLGVSEGALESALVNALDLTTVEGAVTLDDQNRPGFVLTPGSPASRRFKFCRELFEYLAGESTAPRIVTRGVTHRQQRNRAFAAEFLLPASALRDRIPADKVTDQQVDEIAQEFGVSWAVVSHQLDNHRIARITPDG